MSQRRLRYRFAEIRPFGYRVVLHRHGRRMTSRIQRVRSASMRIALCSRALKRCSLGRGAVWDEQLTASRFPSPSSFRPRPGFRPTVLLVKPPATAESRELHFRLNHYTCDFALANRGYDLRLVQDYLGHRDPRHTVHYTRAVGSRFERIWS